MNWDLKIFQFQVVFTTLGGIVAIQLDTQCKQYTKQNYTEDFSGYLGERFLILVKDEQTQFYLQSMCLNEHIPRLSSVTSSKGIRKTDINFPYVKILKMPTPKIGTATVMFTEAVELVSQFYGNILPLERLGTEYFILLPKIQVNELFIHICTLDINTTVVMKVRNTDLKQENSALVRHLGKHEIWTVGRTFDFSGSRVLSTDKIAIFAGFSTKPGTLFATGSYQFLPTYMFGKQYGIINDIVTYMYLKTKVIIRLLAMFDETDIWTASNSSNAIGTMMLRGQLRDLDITSQNALTLFSDKRFIVIRQNERSPLTWMYIVPVRQFVNSLIRYSGEDESVTVFYKMPVDQIVDIKIEVLDTLTDEPLYASYIHQDVFNDTIMRYGELRLNIARHWAYIYLSSRSLLGMLVCWTIYEKKVCSYVETWNFHTTSQDCKLVNQSCEEKCTHFDSCESSNQPKAKKEGTGDADITVVSVVVATSALSALLSSVFGRKMYRRYIKRKTPVHPKRTATL